MSPSKMEKLRKTRAYDAGATHAAGGAGLREGFAPKCAWKFDYRIAYDLGFSEYLKYRDLQPINIARIIIADLLEHFTLRTPAGAEAYERAREFLGENGNG